ncbi:MAG: hypothetical protein HYY25_07295 [Candidatus Wallbacteria bacterium]|nr:hypothetical protein [Candidatus Wallbacteria bacterium]
MLIQRFGLLALACAFLLTGNALAASELTLDRLDPAVFTVLKAEVIKVVVLLKQPPRPLDHGTGTGAGGPDEERAIARIRAMAPQLAGTQLSMDQRIQTIRTIASQGAMGPMAREQAVSAIGQVLASTAHGESVQRAAVLAIKEIGFGSRTAPRVVAGLLRHTGNPMAIRIEAIRALRQITGPGTEQDALEALAGVINNTGHGDSVQHEAVDAVAAIGGDSVPAVQLLSRVLADTSRPIEVRLRTISSMLQLRDPQAREEGVRGLTQCVLNTGHSDRVQLAAVEAIAFIGRFSMSAISAFGRVLQHTANPIDVRLSILNMLAASPASNAREALQAISNVFRNSGHADRVQIRAAQAATRLGESAAADAVEVLALPLRGQSFDRQARIEAIRGLARIGRGQRRAEEILEAVLADSGHADDVRRSAQDALNQLYQN